MIYLVVVAHPDDEVLGAGGLIYKLSRQGEEVNVCILAGQVQARAFRPLDTELEDDVNRSLKMLNVNKKIIGDFPNIKLNTVAHLDLVQFIEQAIIDTKANVIITHHPADLNDDHVQTSRACQAAAKLFQRRKDVEPLKELLYMEVPSATEWGLNKAEIGFVPDTYVEIGKKGVEKKLEALAMYRGVMRDYPHPRSEEYILGLAAVRGGQAGCLYAEAFQTAFRRII